MLFTDLKIIHTVQSLQASAGGPAYSVPALAIALQAHGLEVEVWTGDAGPHLPPGLKVREISTAALAAGLRDAAKISKSLLVHDHGLWLPWNHAVAQASRNAGIPRIVSPRGMLEPWALQHRRWKKRLAWFLYQRRDLRAAGMLHATADSEARGFLRAGLTNLIQVAPNGVDMPFTEPAPVQHEKSVRTLLFLSRIHPKKGLLDLVEAWRRIQAPDWQLVIAGPDENGHLAEVRKAVEKAGMSSQFHFPGPLADASKSAAYDSADLFVLPSYSENFGLVIAEALAAGVPVITTRATPWAELETHACGWWIETGADALECTLREAISLSATARHTLGQRGRELIRTRYGWPAIAAAMLPAYERMESAQSFN